MSLGLTRKTMLKKVVKKTFGGRKDPLVDYKYSIDQVSESQISGWAKNVKLPEHSPVIDVYVNNKLTWQAKSEHFRHDLNEANIGDFAFTLTPDCSVMQSDCNEVEIYIDGHKVERRFPLVLTSTMPHTEKAGVPKAPSVRDDFICYVDVIADTHLEGWAKIKDDDNQHVSVELKNESGVYGSGVASSYRKDLAEAGFGNGDYAFNINFDLAEFTSDAIDVDLYLNDIKFTEEKITLRVDANAIEHAKYVKEFAPQLSELQQALNQEVSDIKAQIEATAGGEPELKDVVNFTIQKIAEFSVRLDTMEKAMLKHLDK